MTPYAVHIMLQHFATLLIPLLTLLLNSPIAATEISLFLQLLKRKYVVGNDIVFKAFKWKVSFDYKAFIPLLNFALAISVTLATDYLSGKPFNLTSFIGNTSTIFTLATFIHRLGISPVNDFISYLGSRKATDSSGSPSA